MATFGITAESVAQSTVQEIAALMVEKSDDIDVSTLKDLLSSPLCLYFGIFCRLNDVWSVKGGEEKRELEVYEYWLPYWAISNVRNFKFYFTLAFQSMINMFAIYVGLMGSDVRTDEHLCSMLNEGLYNTQVLNWTKDDREVFFNDDEEVHFRILMVSTNR
jgi:hypothetical protein